MTSPPHSSLQCPFCYEMTTVEMRKGNSIVVIRCACGLQWVMFADGGAWLDEYHTRVQAVWAQEEHDAWREFETRGRGKK